MIRNRTLHPIEPAGVANLVRDDRPDLAAVDRHVCEVLRGHMAALEEAGMGLSWPVVRGARGEGRFELRIDSPFFFLNDRPGKGFKLTAEARGVRPTEAGRVTHCGGADQFVVAMRNPATKRVDLILYSEGVLILYRDSMTRRQSAERLAVLPADPQERAGFGERAVAAVASRLNPYLFRARRASAVGGIKDLLSRSDIARDLSKAIDDAGGGGFLLDAEVARVATDPELAQRVNGQGCVKQLEYLLRWIGEARTRSVVRRCIQTFAEHSSATAA